MDWLNKIKISFFNAGLISIWDEDWALHLMVFPSYWLFGPMNGLKTKFMGKVNVFGAGPLFLLCYGKK